MKKTISIFLCLVLLACLPGTCMATETDLTQYAIANGIVKASSFDDITAPCSGTLLSFDWEPGDTVEAGTAMFEMMTTNIYAPEDGIVRWLFAEQGDSADSAMATYGAVLALQPSARQRMHCTYSDAADYEENKHLHVGDMLYFKTSKEKGTGIVIATAGDSYEVEILTGTFDADKKMDLYKDVGYDSDDKVGSGVAEVIDIAPRVHNHQMHVERLAGVLLYMFDDGLSKRYVWHEDAVHNVDMQPVALAGVEHLDVALKVAEIST